MASPLQIRYLQSDPSVKPFLTLSLNGKLRPIKRALSMAIAAHNESSQTIRARACACRDIQLKRQGVPNAQMGADALRQHCALGNLEKQILIQAMEKHHLSARSHDRILKVARTIADLAFAEKIELTHLSEAIGYRCLNKD